MNKREIHRSSVLHFRVTPEEERLILGEAEKAALTVSKYLRFVSLKRRVISRYEDNLIHELRRLGGLMKLVHNENKGSYSETTAGAINDIRNAVRKIANGEYDRDR